MSASEEWLRRVLEVATGSAARRCQTALHAGLAVLRAGPSVDAQSFVAIYTVRQQRTASAALREGLERFLVEARKLPATAHVEIAIVEAPSETWQLMATHGGTVEVLSLRGGPDCAL